MRIFINMNSELMDKFDGENALSSGEGLRIA